MLGWVYDTVVYIAIILEIKFYPKKPKKFLFYNHSYVNFGSRRDKKVLFIFLGKNLISNPIAQYITQ